MLASISLDLDNKWSYMKTHGDAGWQDFPTYLPALVPRVLELLNDLGLTITFFVVGQDAIQIENQASLRSIADAGHEIGNHSFHHEPWLHLYSADQIDEELSKTEDAIAQVTSQPLLGFRGPGFSYSETLLSILKKRGYRYDASTFPTFLGPIARAYYFFHAKLNEADREKRKLLFGSASQGFQRLRPYRWTAPAAGLIEIPVTTMPWFKVPIHLSYVMFLAEKSQLLAKTYFYNSMRWCWMNGIEPSLLLHPLDFWGGNDEQDLRFFPAMGSTTETKCKLARELLGWMSKKFDCKTMQQHAEAIAIRSPVV